MENVRWLAFVFSNQLFTKCGRNLIISVKEKGEISCRGRNTRPSRKVQALVCPMPHNPKATIFRNKVSKNVSRIISACVVNDNCLDIFKSLLSDTAQTALDIMADVICSDDDRNTRHGHSFRLTGWYRTFTLTLDITKKAFYKPLRTSNRV